MSKFACIYFKENNIIVSKNKLKEKKELTYQFIEGIELTIPDSIKNYTSKDWVKLERTLLDEDVACAYIEGIDAKKNPFNEIKMVDGKAMLPLLCYAILEYVSKYNLLMKEVLFAHIGIIAGKEDETLNAVGSIMNSVSDLTLYTQNPYTYKGLITEIHDRTRLRVRAQLPTEENLKRVDLVFNLSSQSHYAKMCSSKTIFVDYKKSIHQTDLLFVDTLPIIWQEFDIIWDGMTINLPTLQMILTLQGVSKQSLLKVFQTLDLQVIKASKRRIS